LTEDQPQEVCKMASCSFVCSTCGCTRWAQCAVHVDRCGILVSLS
jgi:hypothetical protein